jgi:hypothetical protein
MLDNRKMPATATPRCHADADPGKKQLPHNILVAVRNLSRLARHGYMLDNHFPVPSRRMGSSSLAGYT